MDRARNSTVMCGSWWVIPGILSRFCESKNHCVNIWWFIKVRVSSFDCTGMSRPVEPLTPHVDHGKEIGNYRDCRGVIGIIEKDTIETTITGLYIG